MNARDLIGRHGRTTAVAGAVLAVSAAGLMTVVATANAAPTGGVCAQTVNVRHDPDINSRIVAVCDAGKKVTVAETKSGFVHLTDLGGWAAQEYVSVNGHTPSAPVDREESDDSAGDNSSDDDSGTDSEHASTGAHSSGGSAGRSHGAPSASKPETPSAPAAQSDDSDDNSGSDNSGSDSSGSDSSGSDASGSDDQASNGGSSDSDDSPSSDTSNDSGDDSGHVGLIGS